MWSKADPAYRNGKDQVASRATDLLFIPPVLAGLMQMDSERGNAEGKEMEVGGESQQHKGQLWSKAEVKEAAGEQGWSKCQHMEETISLQWEERSLALLSELSLLQSFSALFLPFPPVTAAQPCPAIRQ